MTTIVALPQSDSPTNDIWGLINNDIATFLAAIGSLSANGSDNDYEALLLATDRLLWASGRARQELERVLSNRKKSVPIRRFSPRIADVDGRARIARRFEPSPER
jgi:hypothetical protein